MLQRAAGTAISLLIVAIAYSGYAMLVVPWIEPAGTSRNELIADDRWLPMTPHLREELARLFSPGFWQLASPTIIKSSHGTLIFKKNTRTNKRLEIKPVTIVVYVSQLQGQELVCQAPLTGFKHREDLIRLCSTSSCSRALQVSIDTYHTTS